MNARGGASWSATCCKQYGKERWRLLLSALADAPTQLAFVAPNISHSALRYLLRKPRFSPCLIPNCFITGEPDSDLCRASNINPDLVASGQPHAAIQELAAHTRIVDDDHVVEEAREKTYFLDGASALAAYVLGARPGEVVLDMCAAPGGKSLIISCMISSARVPSYLLASQSLPYLDRVVDDEIDEGGLLVCNDGSRDRLARLQATLAKFLPAYATAGQRLQFSCADACKGGAFERFAPYDKILLDAPCSSDRHLLHKGGSALANWSPSTPKLHAERQLKMLFIASKLLKKNSILLYTTCSLSHMENDGVIDKFLKKANAKVKILPLFDGEWPPEVKLLDRGSRELSIEVGPSSGQRPFPTVFLVEKLKYGYAMLPDVSKFGPMYFCRMQIIGE